MWEQLRKTASDVMVKEAAKLIMYHGTSSNNIPSILSKGLIPHHKGSVVWEGSSGKDPFLSSYYGVYFTDLLGAAFHGAWDSIQKSKGNPAIIIAQVESRSPNVVLDEDLLKHPSFYWWMHPSAGELDYELKKISDEKLKEWISQIPLPEERKRIIYPDAEEFYRLYKYKKFAEHLWQDLRYNRLGWDNMELIKRFVNSDRTNLLITGWDSIPIIDDDLVEASKTFVKQVLEKFRDITDKLIRKAKELTYDARARLEKDSIDWFNVRVTEPVTFKGANRIIGVLEFVGEHNQNVIVRYSSDDDVVNNAIEKFKKERTYSDEEVEVTPFRRGKHVAST